MKKFANPSFKNTDAGLDTVNSIDCHTNNQLIVTGSMDGAAKLWNSTSGKCVGTLLCGPKV